ncbi:MAG: substrate-binding domain-containing protein [Methanomassiliicoccales archaeon]|nr:substrate-binding domain-containing protein [Methanomassiliicoccales archaeon]
MRWFCGLLVLLTGVVGLAVTEAKYTFYFVTHMGPADPNTQWYLAGIKEAEKILPIKVIYSAPEVFSVEKQRELIEAAIAAKPDGLVVSITDPVAFDEPLRRAIAEGLPVVAVNIPDMRPESERIPYIAYVGGDEYLTGYKIAERVYQEAQARGVKPVKALFINHHVGHAGIMARYKGWCDFFEPLGVKTVHLAASEDPTVLYEVTRSGLEANPDVNLIFAPAGWAAPWAHKAAKDLGRADQILFGTVDDSPFSIEGILRGYLVCSHSQQFFLQGFLPVMWLYIYLEYGYKPALVNQLTGPIIIDKSNAMEFKEANLKVLGEELYNKLIIWTY